MRGAVRRRGMTCAMHVLLVIEHGGRDATALVEHFRAPHAETGVETEFFEVPPPGVLRRMIGGRLTSMWAARRFLRAHVARFDVIVVAWPRAALLATRELAARPSVVVTDTANTTTRVERRVYDAATIVVATSERTAELLRTTGAVPERKLRVLVGDAGQNACTLVSFLEEAQRVHATSEPSARPPCTPATPRCEFWNWGEGFVRPACCTAHLTDIAGFAHHALADAGIVHWLDYGSLL